MKTLRLTSCLLATCLIFSACSAKNEPPVPPAPAKQAKAEKMPSKEEMMEKWKEYSTPGQEHKDLNKMIGVWKYTMKMWMDPAAAPEVTTGKSEVKWTMNGRFVEQNVSGKSMGQNFTGRAIIGFDKATKKYRSVWYDSMGTGMMIGSGTFNKDTLEESGTASCPFKGTIPYRFNTKFTDNDHYTSEMFMTNPYTGAEERSMELQYTRSKK